MALKYKLTVFQIHHVKMYTTPMLTARQCHMFQIIWYFKLTISNFEVTIIDTFTS